MPKRTSLDGASRAQIDSFIARINGLVRQSAIASVQAALTEGGPASARRGPGRPRGSGKAKRGRPAKRGPGRPNAARAAPGRRIRRSPADLDKLSSTILAYVRSHPGSRLEEVGRGLKRDTAGLKRPVAKLLAETQVRTEGQKRGTKYFARGGKGGAKRAKAAREVRRGGARRKGGRKARPRVARKAPPRSSRAKAAEGGGQSLRKAASKAAGRRATRKAKPRAGRAGRKRGRRAKAAATVTLRPVKPVTTARRPKAAEPTAVPAKPITQKVAAKPKVAPEPAVSTATTAAE